MPVQIRCPKCESVLRMEKRPEPGKMLRCRSCSATFAIKGGGSKDAPPSKKAAARKPAGAKRRPASGAAPKRSGDERPRRRPPEERPRRRRPEPEADPWDDDFGDDYGDDFLDDDYGDDYDDDFEAPARPARKGGGRKKGRSRKKGRAGNSAMKPFLIALLCVVGVGGVGGLGFLAWKQFGPRNAIDLTYLPEQTELVVRVDFAGLSSAPILSQLMDKLPDPRGLTDMMNQAELDPKDIESLTVGVYNENGALGRGTDRFVGVVEFARNVSPEDLQKTANGRALGTETEFGGETYYRGADMCTWFVSSRTVVWGHEDDVRDAIERSEKELRLERFDFVDDDGGELLIAIAPRDPQSFTSAAAPLNSPATSALRNSLADGARGFCFSLSAGSDLGLMVQVACSDNAAAEKILKEFQSGLKQLDDQLKQVIATPLIGEAFKPLQNVSERAEASQSGTDVYVTTSLKGEEMEALMDSAAPFMGGGGPPGFGPSGFGPSGPSGGPGRPPGF